MRYKIQYTCNDNNNDDNNTDNVDNKTFDIVYINMIIMYIIIYIDGNNLFLEAIFHSVLLALDIINYLLLMIHY